MWIFPYMRFESRLRLSDRDQAKGKAESGAKSVLRNMRASIGFSAADVSGQALESCEITANGCVHETTHLVLGDLAETCPGR